MLGLSGLFVPIAMLPPMLRAIAHALPLTYMVSLLRGIWRGEDGLQRMPATWPPLAFTLLVCTASRRRFFGGSN